MKPENIVSELEKIVEASQDTCRVQAIFGEPAKLATQTIVPVGAILTSFGGGGGGIPLVGGGGVGVQLRVLPLGFIHEQDGAVRFTPIELPAGFERIGHDAGKRQPHESAIDKVRRRIADAVTRARAPR
jgi:uncharacterized spore protein YtfJ